VRFIDDDDTRILANYPEIFRRQIAAGTPFGCTQLLDARDHDAAFDRDCVSVAPQAPDRECFPLRRTTMT
jgi:hypothetical protein